MMPRLNRVLTPLLVLQFLVVALLLESGCGSKKTGKEDQAGASGTDAKSTTPPAEMDFNIDPALLGMTIVDSTLGLRFAPPQGWPPIEPDLFDATREAYSRLARVERFTSQPVRIFSDGEKRFFLILSDFPHWPVPLDPYVAFADYARQLQGAITSLDIQQTFYRHGKLDVYHLVIGNPAMVDHRLMILREDRLPVQVDYLVPRVAYPTMVKAVESSIGSFEAL